MIKWMKGKWPEIVVSLINAERGIPGFSEMTPLPYIEAWNSIKDEFGQPRRKEQIATSSLKIQVRSINEVAELR